MRSHPSLSCALLAFTLGSGCMAVAQTPSQETTTIAESTAGTKLQVHRFGAPGEDAHGRGPDQRPALLVVSGLHAGHGLGNALAQHIADNITAGHDELLNDVTLYVIHSVNADGVAQRGRDGSPISDFGGYAHIRDADQDGRMGEDPGEDLNGDGFLTTMRVKDPAPGSGLKAEWIVDPDDARLLRKPDLLDGERARYALVSEGTDNDGDGKFNEDGIGGAAGSGTDLDKNFPALWPELEDGAGVVPVNRPETRAIVDWMLGHDNIKAVLTFGPHDNLVKLPETDKYGPAGRVPLGIEKTDKDWYEHVSEEYKELTGFKNAESRDRRGSFHHWAYSHFGVYSFTTPGWYRPEAAKKSDDKADDVEADDAKAEEAAPVDQAAETVKVGDLNVVMTSAGVAEAFSAMENATEAESAAMQAAVGALDPQVRARLMSLGSQQESAGPSRTAGSSSRSKKKKDDDSTANWVAYLDEHRGGEGFTAWTEVEHPQLGTVEVGGLHPGIQLQPPQDEWSDLMQPHMDFVVSLMGKLPQLRVEEPVAERVGPGLWKVRVSVRNDGLLPTTSNMGVKTRRIPPVLALIEVEDDNLVSGRKIQRWESIDGSGTTVTAEWWILADDGSNVNVEVRSMAHGNRSFAVALN